VAVVSDGAERARPANALAATHGRRVLELLDRIHVGRVSWRGQAEPCPEVPQWQEPNEGAQEVEN
jgi:hypothetical protein